MEDEVISTQSNEVEQTHESVREVESQKSEQVANQDLYDRVRFGDKSKVSAPENIADKPSGEGKETVADKNLQKVDNAPRNKAAERIGELTRKYHTSKTELDKLRQEFEDYRKSSKPLSRAETANDEEYIAKLTEQKVNERLANEQMSRMESEANNAQNEIWNESIKSQVENYSEFVTNYKKFAPVIEKHDQITAEYVRASDVGPKMLNELFDKMKDPNFENKWFTMPTAKKNVLLYELEKYVSSNQQQQKQSQQIQPKQSVPKSIVPGTGNGDQGERSSAQQLYEKIRYGR